MDPSNTLSTCSSSDDDDDDDNEDDILALLAFYLYQEHFAERPRKRPRRTSVGTGAAYVTQVLRGPNDQCFEKFRMSADMFIRLRDTLQERGKLHDTPSAGVDEQLAIFLDTIGHNSCCRDIQEKYQHSSEMISQHFNSMLNAIVSLKDEYIKIPEASISPVLRFNNDFYPYFKNCLGVIDGDHIPAMVKWEDQGEYLNKKGFPSQKMMAVVSFDRTFAFIVPGKAGLMTDMDVLRLALEHDGFRVPEGKYYLVGSHYANLANFIAPYKGFRYHLSEFQADRPHTCPAEIFNHRHAKLWDVVKRTFAVLKERFPILKLAPPYSYSTQVKLVVAACVIHNFIRKEQVEDQLFDLYDQENFVIDYDSEDEQENPNIGVLDADLSAGDKVRKEIAELLWSS